MSVTIDRWPPKFCSQRLAGWLGILLGTIAVLQLSPAHAGDRMRLQRITTDNQNQVRAYVTLLDELGGPLLNKPAGAFQLLVDSSEVGAASQAVSFASAREPIFVSVVIQTSTSMQAALSEAVKGLQGLVQALEAIPGSQLAVVRFSDKAEVLLAAGSGAEARAAVNKLSTAQGEGGAGAVSAISQALGLVRPQPAHVRRLLLFIGDGQSLTDKKALADAGKAAAQNGVPISTIAVGGLPARAITELSKRSNGIERGIREGQELSVKLNEIVEEVKQQYVLTFKARIDNPAAEHIFQISDKSAQPVYSNTLSIRLTAAAR